MTPSEQLLSFIGAGSGPTDRIRIMKGLFLFTQRVKEGHVQPAPETFAYEAMSYGPCAMGIYDSITELKSSGLIAELPVPGETWSRYIITPAGQQRIAGLQGQPGYSLIQRIREWCDRQNFTSLLAAVYRAYPDYAKNSVLSRLRPNG